MHEPQKETTVYRENTVANTEIVFRNHKQYNVVYFSLPLNKQLYQNYMFVWKPNEHVFFIHCEWMKPDEQFVSDSYSNSFFFFFILHQVCISAELNKCMYDPGWPQRPANSTFFWENFPSWSFNACSHFAACVRFFSPAMAGTKPHDRK